MQLKTNGGQKMNKYIKLIQSKAIREYLNEIRYIPSTFEAIYIIEKNNKITLDEKHKLWDEIIDTMPDEKIKKTFKFGALTLHEYLKKYMEIQRKLYDQFFKQEQNVVYTCSSGVVVDWKNKKPLIKNPFYWCNIYIDLELCIQDAHEKKHPLFDVRKHYIKTKPNDADYRCVWADFTSDGEILDIGELYVLNDDEDELYEFLKTETISIPLPFKKGDLICYKGGELWEHGLMELKNYKNGYIHANGPKENVSFCLNNVLDIEFADKDQCVKVLKEALLFCDDAVVVFIKEKGLLSEEEISVVYNEY